MAMVDQLAPEDIEVEEVGLSTEELRPGTRLGRYELLLAIAKGGMARVWAARQHGQRGFSKTVAIKTILPHLAEEAEFERMFLDEARIAAMIHHPNVCEIYELGEEGKVLYLAMEWVNGESLVHILRSSGKMAPMEPRLAARIIADACAGIHAAHNLTDEEGRPLGVVHRDVSPHNILVSADGNVKVADFGVAKALGQMHSATMAGQVKGKISYMAPEQIAGAAADRRIDIFAMGVVLYETTTGQRPFKGENDPQVMHAIVQNQFVPPTRVMRSYPAELEAIVLKAMSPDPTQRYPTAERMRMALEEYLARSGSIITQSNVGAFVHQCVGNVLDRRRDRIRAAANAPNPEDISGSGQGMGTPSAPVVSGVHQAGRGTPSQPQSMPQSTQQPVSHSDLTGPSIVAAMARQQAQPPSAAKYAIAAAIGVFVAVLIGVAVIVGLRMRSQDAPEAVKAQPSSRPTSTESAGVAPAVTAAGPSTMVEFRGLPSDAVLNVDGQALAASVREVPRPPKGKSTVVKITAQGFGPETLTLDDSTPSSVEVALTFAAPTNTTSTTNTTNTNAATATTNTSSTSAPTATHRPALPANPY